MAGNRLLRVVVYGGMGLIGAAASGGLLACETKEPMREGPPPPIPREGPPPPSTYTSPIIETPDASAAPTAVPDAAVMVPLPVPREGPPPPRRIPREGPPPHGNGH